MFVVCFPEYNLLPSAINRTIRKVYEIVCNYSMNELSCQLIFKPAYIAGPIDFGKKLYNSEKNKYNRYRPTLLLAI